MLSEPTGTRTDPTSLGEWQLDDAVVRLREWGTGRVYPLPAAPSGEWVVGSGARCDLRLVDPNRFVSRRHARLVHEHATWTLADLGSKNGLWMDNARGPFFVLTPGVEVGIGSLRLVAESQRLIAVRAFLCRILGWGDGRAPQVDRALGALRELAARRAALVLCGDGDLVPIVRALHRRAFGGSRPFVVNDPQRRAAREVAFAGESIAGTAAAVEAARGGTLCVSAHRSAAGLAALRELAADPSRKVALVICARSGDALHEGTPQQIVVPPLGERVGELEQIVDEYAEDAIAVLGAKRTSYTAIEAAMTLRRAPQTLGEIETTVRRLIAIREYGGVTRAATHLGISHVALSRWLSRR